MAPRDLVVGGLHAVRSALEHAPETALELWLKAAHDNPDLRSIAELAARNGLEAQPAAVATLDKLNGDPHHQGAVLRRRAPATVALDHVLAGAATAGPALLLVLDSVQDPRNFGACLRAADGAGVSAVIFPRDKSAPLTATAAKAASGAIDTLALVPVANLASAMRTIAAAGVWLTGAVHDAQKTLYEIDFKGPSALVLGNEGTGLRRLTRDRCDELARIPMAGEVASLNVATAAAVCLFEARRQREAGG